MPNEQLVTLLGEAQFVSIKSEQTPRFTMFFGAVA